MNCANCGTEIELGFLCEECEETAARNVIDGARKAGTLLSPMEEIIMPDDYGFMFDVAMTSPASCKKCGKQVLPKEDEEPELWFVSTEGDLCLDCTCKVLVAFLRREEKK